MNHRKLLGVLSAGLLVGLFANVASASTTAVLLPISDGYYKDFKPSTGSTHYTMVDEASCNGTTDYVATSTVAKRDSYGINISSVGNGARITQIDIVPCASRNLTGTGTATSNVFYRYNGADSLNFGRYALPASTTPTQLATTTISSLNFFKTATSTLEIGFAYSAGDRGARLSRLATVLTYTLTAPSAPTGLSATNISSTQNDLAWTDNSTNELGFKVYRSQNGGSYSQIATTTWNIVAYNNTSLTADQTYQYKVVAYNSAGTATSNIATAITYNSAPSAPSSLSASSYGSNVVLSWTDGSYNEDGFSIERGTDGISFAQIATTTLNIASTTSWTDVAPGSGSFYYRVRAFNTIGNSSYSNTDSVTFGPTLNRVDVYGLYNDETWTPDNLYVVNANISITSAKLIIQAGTIVKFAGGGCGFSVTSSGVIVAEGTSGNKVYFTSIKDDFGGNTDGLSTPPAAQDWLEIQVNYGASATFTNAVVRYAGFYGYGTGGIGTSFYNTGGNLVLEDSEVSTSVYYGIYADSGTTHVTGSDIYGVYYGTYAKGGTMTVSDNSLHDLTNSGIYGEGTGSLVFTGNDISNAMYAVMLYLDGGIQFTHSGNTISGTGNHHGLLVSGTLGADETLTAGDGFPYISDTLIVPSGRTLTMEAGTILKFDGASGLTVHNGGVFRANGTDVSPLYLTTILDDDAGGDTNNDNSNTRPGADSSSYWDSINLNSGASSTITHAVIRYGGRACCGFSQANIFNNGGTLNLFSSEVASSTTYGVYQASGTSTIVFANIHDDGSDGIYASGGIVNVTSSNLQHQSFGVYVAGATVTISSTQTHDQSRGLYIGSGTLSVTSSDIFFNTYGIRYGGGTLNLSENAIHENTSYGVYNDTATLIDVANNWWGTWVGASWSGANPNCDPNYYNPCSDLINDTVTSTPWQHAQSYWSVRNFALTWSSTSTYTNTDLAAATFNWNSVTAGAGLIPVSSIAPGSGENIDIYEATSTDPNALGRTVSATSVHDHILLYKKNIDDIVDRNNGLGLGWLWRRYVLIHELGHALGLAHSDPVGGPPNYTDVMYSTDNGQTDFGPEDKRDFNFLWNTLRWAAPRWWPT